MAQVNSLNRINMYKLPVRVDWSALAPVLDRMASVDASALWVLSFHETRHIQFHDLQRFVGRVRQLGPFSRPIVLAGLNPYCEQILHFALIPRDWDLFIEVTGDFTFAAPGAQGTREGIAAASERSGDGLIAAAFSLLSLN